MTHTPPDPFHDVVHGLPNPGDLVILKSFPISFRHIVGRIIAVHTSEWDIELLDDSGEFLPVEGVKVSEWAPLVGDPVKVNEELALAKADYSRARLTASITLVRRIAQIARGEA